MSVLNMDVQWKDWRKNFLKLEKDFEVFESWFFKNKICDCKYDESTNYCKHYFMAIKRIMGNKIDQSWIELTKIMHNQFSNLKKA